MEHLKKKKKKHNQASRLAACLTLFETLSPKAVIKARAKVVREGFFSNKATR